ncbi:MAG TPA: LuxR C-terminal-related transcriptional regulator [Modestobacter sp.]|nr:LuxR C-terminal-related transcriptional regulator [Modestobacter sp.]
MPADPSAGDLPANTMAILTEVSGIAAAPGGLAERAEALLAQVERVLPFEAGTIALLPAGQRVYQTLSRHGFDDHVNAYYDGPRFFQDVELAGLRRSPLPQRVVDLPVPPAEIPLWGEYLLPAGFHEGFGVGLFTPDRRYLGLLGAAIERATPPDPDTINLIGLLAPQIATAVDPLRSLSTIAAMVHAAIAGVVLAPSGAVLPLAGLPDHRLLTLGSGVLAAAAAQLADGGPHAAFLAPLPSGAGAETHARITVLATPTMLQVFATAIVLVSPAGELHGLSHRELEVLGLLVTGASNERIAGTLRITRRTVEAHVDHVRGKLDAPSRTAAAARALRLGLFVPSPLSIRPGAPTSHADWHGRPRP